MNMLPKEIYGFNAIPMKLLLLLSHFSCVRLCVTPEMAAHQAPPSLGFSRQEHWSGLPFPSSMRESKSESEVAQSCLALSDPMDCSLPGSSVHRFSRQEYWSGVPLPSPTYEATNVIFHRTRTNNFTICMETQKTSNSQSNLEKEEWNWRN